MLSVLSDAAPLLCLVDDAQWLDGASADALTFAARRVGAEPIAFLFAARTFPARGLPVLELDGLSADAASSLLPDVAAPVRDRLVAEMLGNPLALTELARSLTRRSWPEPHPCRHLCRSSRTCSWTRCAVSTPSCARRCWWPRPTTPGRSAWCWTPRHAWAFLPWPSPTCSWSTPATCRSATRCCARRSTRPPPSRNAERPSKPWPRSWTRKDADRRAWHLANAAVGPDETVADALHHSAHRARRRGGHAAAATACTRAAALTSDRKSVV